MELEPALVRRALFSRKARKAPEPDRLGASVLQLLWEWAEERLVGLVVHSLRLQTHPRTWKVARGVPIPKPNETSYDMAKSYRTISLLNCLGKVTERVVAELLSRHCEGQATLHPGQFGARTKRSAVEAVVTLISWVEER